MGFPIRVPRRRVAVMTKVNNPVQSTLVVGAGAAGTLTAARLLDEAVHRRVEVDVTLVDRRPEVGRGVAYSTVDERHLLNVPAYQMSAYPEDGEHFLCWLDARGDRVDPYDFAPRALFGEYLAHVLAESTRAAAGSMVGHVCARAVDVEVRQGRCHVVLDTGERMPADNVVLALGHLGVDTSWAPFGLVSSPRFVADPWAAGALASIPPDGDVLLVGTGLTMIDTFASTNRPGRVVHAVSRRGHVPHRHADHILPRMEPPDFGTAPGLAELRDAMSAHLQKARARYGDWRPAVDSIRAITQRLWRGLSAVDQAEFVALDARGWEAMRHRTAPQTGAVVADGRRSGALRIHRGSVRAVTEFNGGFEVALSDGTVLRVSAVVNCTGPCDRPEDSTEPLVRRLLERGLVRPGPLGIGVDTSNDGRVIGVDGSSAPIWTLGSLRKGSLWECTAMPDIRDQAAGLARRLVKADTRGDVRPVDLYGFRLSATPDAADAWRRALRAIQLVHGGAEQEIATAVELDPGFAMGHAALALLGREWDLPIDVAGSMGAAAKAIRVAGDAHERSFVHMALARLTQDREAGDRELLRHINAYPRDCLAVSVALPTIAFSGLAGPIEQSWALVDWLAPEYGDDWWFTGIAAFTRQDQSRWAESERLAAQAMATEPSSGHAAHALTHVFYETGAHVDGLRWLDGWMDEHGRSSNHRAHYSWHAALHELALDDIDAVRCRYRDQLAPPTVTGARALIDSASLVWRLRVSEVECPELAIDGALGSVDDCVFERPATPFAALHAVVGLAVAGDADRIRGIGEFASRSSSPVYADVITPLCEGFAAVVEDRPADAIEPLTRVVSSLPELGGSAAQQEIVTETLLYALVRAGQCSSARAILAERLDRRGSPADQRRLRSLPL
jgi:uncharacterized NAD(P)/FAD-binding protein YdhS